MTCWSERFGNLGNLRETFPILIGAPKAMNIKLIDFCRSPLRAPLGVSKCCAIELNMTLKNALPGQAEPEEPNRKTKAERKADATEKAEAAADADAGGGRDRSATPENQHICVVRNPNV